MAKQQGRIIMQIDILQGAVDSLVTSAENRGMTQIATTSRIVQWFLVQDEEVQAAILNTHPAAPSSDELTRLIMDRMHRE